MKKNLKIAKEKIAKSGSKGITLIALVVTIVVLLILAGITINAVLSEGGIFNTAKNAQNVQQQATIKEKVEMMLADAQLQKLVNNKSLKAYFEEQGYRVTENTTAGTISITLEGKKVTINENTLQIMGMEETIVANTDWYTNAQGSSTYTISTAGELLGLASIVNEGTDNFSGKTVVLNGNIDLKNNDWTPIGETSAKAFAGTFNGQDYTISNFNTSGVASAGLFGYLTGTVKNVKVQGINLQGTTYAGGIVGYAETGIVENCVVDTGEIKANTMGGIAGYSNTESNFSGNTVNNLNCTITYSSENTNNTYGKLIGSLPTAEGTNNTFTDFKVKLVGTVDNDTDLNAVLIENANIIDITVNGELNLMCSGSENTLLGGADTESIILKGTENSKITLATNYVSKLNMQNLNGTLYLEDLEMTSTQTQGTWNTYDIMFECNTSCKNIRFEKCIALGDGGDGEGKKYTLNNVEINDTYDAYGIWISAKGSDVSFKY